jgi:hypothetical protein
MIELLNMMGRIGVEPNPSKREGKNILARREFVIEMLKSVENLERELNEANELNDHAWNQISIGKDFLV